MFGLEKYATQAIIIGLLIAGVLGWFAWHDHKVRVQALQDFNKQQFEQVQKDAVIFKEKMDKLSQSLDVTLKTLNELNAKTEQISKDVQSEVDNLKLPDAGVKAPAQIQETIKLLRKKFDAH